jgi:hypothetical protein
LASASDHLIQAKSNEELAGLLATIAYADWRCTVLYYASLHYLQAYFTGLTPPRQFKTHAARDAAIQSDPDLIAIWRDYRSLEDWSRKARYDLSHPQASDFGTDITPSLKRINEHLKRYVPAIDIV